MNYEEIFSALGWAYLGPCKCRYEKGYIFQSPERKELQLWIYPRRLKIKKREWDITKGVWKYSSDGLEEMIKKLSAHELV